MWGLVTSGERQRKWRLTAVKRLLMKPLVTCAGVMHPKEIRQILYRLFKLSTECLMARFTPLWVKMQWVFWLSYLVYNWIEYFFIPHTTWTICVFKYYIAVDLLHVTSLPPCWRTITEDYSVASVVSSTNMAFVIGYSGDWLQTIYRILNFCYFNNFYYQY